MIGTRLGPYEIVETIGQGGMGHVYRAVQASLGRVVAVKTMLPSLAADGEFVERFLREARATAKLAHPGIVTIHDVGEENGVYYFAMEFLDGKPLDAILRERGALPVEEATALVAQVASALGHAHAAGILHRDVKPANIMVDGNGRAVLTDFGIAWTVSDTRLTRTGSAIGSPDYMAPEQVEGQRPDQRSDLYSLGVVFFQLLTGEAPYKGDSAIALAYQHVNAPIRSVREQNSSVPPSVDAIVRRLLAKRPEERYASADELVAALSGQAGSSPLGSFKTAAASLGTSQRRLTLGVSALLALVGLALTAGVYLYLNGGSSVSVRRGGVSVATAGPAAAGTPPPPGATLPPAAGQTEAELGSPDSVLPVSGQPQSQPARSEQETPPPVSTPAGPLDEAVVPTPTQPQAEPVPSAPISERFTITSRPAGAEVRLDGEVLADRTPAVVDLSTERTYRLELTLAEHNDAGFTFAFDDLSRTQRDSRALHFPMTPSVVPGRLAVQGAYAVTLEMSGRSYAVEPGGDVSVAPGDHEVTILAPDVFLTARRAVTVTSDEVARIMLPPVASVTVAANPANCRVSIDGIDVGYLPTTVRLVVGTHDFRFDWETQGKTTSVTRPIRLDTDRVFVVAPP